MTDFTIPRGLFVEDTALTVPISIEARNALIDFNARHHEELVEVLAPFGLHPDELTAPQPERYIKLVEIAEF